jgi:serine/alanine adding enzyme
MLTADVMAIRPDERNEDGETRVVVVADCGKEEWDGYVSARSDASGYHMWRWRAVFEGFGHETQYLAARRGDRIVGILPLVLFRSRLFGTFMVSLPFVNYGGIVADDEVASDGLLAEAERIGKSGGFEYLELRHQTRRFNHLPFKQHKVSMLLPLAATAEHAWDSMDRKVRNQIRKAEKSGLTASAGGIECLDDFYAIFARNMRDLGTPVYARAFFERALAVNADRAAVVIVRRGSLPVAAGIALCNGDAVEVPWASSLSEFRSLCPNHVLYWFIMQWAMERQFRVLDFGRSTPNEGTFQFKQQWGAEPLPLCWEYRLFRRADLPDQSPKNPKFRSAIELWKRCPLWFTNALGPHVVRSIP